MSWHLGDGEVIRTRDMDGEAPVRISTDTLVGSNIRSFLIVGKALMEMFDERDLAQKIDEAVQEQADIWYFG